MSAVVTGASGFLGQALVRELLARGRSVRALVRRPEAEAELEALGATTHMADLDDAERCAGLVQPGDTVYHAAARVDLSGRWDDFERTTVGGTQNLLAAGLPSRPARFVYISSGAVYAGTDDPRGVCADRSPTGPAAYNYYGRAKLQAEQLVRRVCDQAGCAWTIVRLCFIYGAGNRALIRGMAPLLRRKRLPLIGTGENRIATINIDDAVDALLRAGEQPAAAGRIYDVASDEPVTQKQFLEATADALELPRPKRTVRPSLARLFAHTCEIACGLVGRPSPVTRTMVELMGADQIVDAGAIREELGWRPDVRFEEGMRRMAEWYRRAGEEAAARSADPPAASASRTHV